MDMLKKVTNYDKLWINKNKYSLVFSWVGILIHTISHITPSHPFRYSYYCNIFFILKQNEIAQRTSCVYLGKAWSKYVTRIYLGTVPFTVSLLFARITER
jgi:hypothetical protein